MLGVNRCSTLISSSLKVDRTYARPTDDVKCRASEESERHARLFWSFGVSGLVNP